MQFLAKARYVRYSPFKLRPLVDVVRGKNAQYALDWLMTCQLQRALPVRKIIASATANAKSLKDVDAKRLRIKDIRVDQGPTHRYFKPGAMGRANMQRKRLSHLSIILEIIDEKEV
jgi:large subunit ribosomal protein L22